MSKHIQKKYIDLISDRLERFKWEGAYQDIARCRCPLCGDSKKSKYKTRGYFYTTSNGNYAYKCHNCGARVSLLEFLNIMDNSIAQNYRRETFLYKKNYGWDTEKISDSNGSLLNTDLFKQTVSFNDSVPDAIKALDSDIALDYLQRRKIPEKYWKDLYYTDHFQRWVNTNISSGKFQKLVESDKRLIIPFRTHKKKIYAYQGRTLEDSYLRYITINEYKKPLVYGLDRCNTKEKVYIFEGPIDSMYVENSLACAGANLKRLAGLSNAVFVFDNQPRNVEIVKIIEELLKSNPNISMCLFPDNIEEKDIGELVESGYSLVDVKNFIDENTYTGMKARLKFIQWKKI